MRIFGPVPLIFLLLTTLPLMAAPPIRGILVCQEYPGIKASSYTFTEIYWQSASIGILTKLNGERLKFDNSNVLRLVYLDEPYWKQLNDDDSQRIFRAELHSVETVLPLNRRNMTTEADLKVVMDGLKDVELLQQELPSSSELLLAVQANLSRQVAWYNQGQRKLNGKWLTADQYAAKIAEESHPSTKNVLVTLDGKSYLNYQVTRVDPDSLHIIYEDGAATVNFKNLSKEIQDQYHFDPVKAAEFEKKEQQVQADQTIQPSSVANSIPQAAEETELEAFLALQPPESVERYRRLFALLDTQKITLQVVSSSLTHEGLNVTKFYPVGPCNLDPQDTTPLMIIGQFPESINSSVFTIQVYPAGIFQGKHFSGCPPMRRFVTKKLDYLRVMEAGFQDTESRF